MLAKQLMKIFDRFSMGRSDEEEMIKLLSKVTLLEEENEYLKKQVSELGWYKNPSSWGA